MADEKISGLDDLLYDVTLTDNDTGDPFTSGDVTMVLCKLDTVEPLGDGSIQALEHVGEGRWKATHDADDFAADLPALNKKFDRVIKVAGITDGRHLARCRRVAIIKERPE